MGYKYVLITPARNEEAYIERTIQSVISQTILPVKWIIVNDNSTDKTEVIADKYVSMYDFINLVNIKSDDKRNFSSKANAFNIGFEKLEINEYEYIGNLDADVTFKYDYFEKILKKFEEDSQLGLAGGIIFELIKNSYIRQNINLNSVAGAVQLFRRQCFEEIGGYIPLRSGGIDTVAEVMARMYGWKTITFSEMKVFHHRCVGTGTGNFYKSHFKKGIQNYSIGYHPFFQILYAIKHFKNKPFLITSILMLLGYLWAFLSNHNREVSNEFVKYLRSEQMKRIGF